MGIMANPRIRLKHSTVQDKVPDKADAVLGELFVNAHENSPGIYSLTSDGEITKLTVYVADDISDVDTTTAPPASGQALIWDGSNWVPGDASLHPDYVKGGDGIAATTGIDEVTLALDLASGDDGLEIDGGKLKASVATTAAIGSVKIGSGIQVTPAGEISAEFSPTVADGRYLRTDSGAPAQTVESTDRTKFKGDVVLDEILEFSGRVIDYDARIEPNICHANYGSGSGPLRIQGALDYSVSIALSGTNAGISTSNSTTGVSANFKLDGEAPSNVNNHVQFTSFIGEIPDEQTFTRCASKLTHFNLSTANFADARPDEVSGYKIPNSLKSNAVAATYGVKGEMSDTGNAYHLYLGKAPNYMGGSTYIGGTTSRNTLELWKSTLTEEQIETLEAGTLVAPANVSEPGDGEFARQWYYDQQDEETQDELTAGTQEYPEHLLAANFTDTFALGDNTRINLLSSGLGEFKDGVKVSSASAGLILTSPDGSEWRLTVDDAGVLTTAAV